MAAPLWNFVVHGRHVLKPTFACSIEKYYRIPICRISTGTNLWKKRSHAFSAHKFEKIMTKKKKKFYFDPVNTSQLGKVSTSNLSKKFEKKLGQQDSVKLRVYNTILHEHITDLVNSNFVSEELESLEVPILSVRMAGDMSVARVYWQASGNTETDQAVQNVLDKYTGRIRHALISLRVLGNIPRVSFLKDKAAANIAEIDHLLATADFGPSSKENDTLEYDPCDGAVPLHKGSHAEGGGVGEAKTEGSVNKYKGPNYFAVDHAAALQQIANRKRQESINRQDGFTPISDSVEKFKLFQRKKRTKKSVRDDEAVYRGQLQMDHTYDDDNMDEVNDRFDQDDETSDIEMETNTDVISIPNNAFTKE